MKNLIIIDVDSEREKQIIVGKGPEIPQPQTKEEAREMIINDIRCVCETLKLLIGVASDSGFGKKDEFVTESIKEMSKLLIE